MQKWGMIALYIAIGVAIAYYMPTLPASTFGKIYPR
jgi:hypothetical protein